MRTRPIVGPGRSGWRVVAIASAATLLLGAVTIDTPPPGESSAPGVDQAQEEQLFHESGISPARSITDLLPDQRNLDNRIQALIRIAQRELAKPEPVQKSARKAGAADRTTGSALLTLGLLYYHGIELPADRERALQLFVRARLLGNKLAALALAWCYLDGCNGAPNQAAFEKMMRAVSAQNQKRANYFLYEQARRAADADDTLPRKAERYLRAASIAGDRFALNEVGLLEVERGNLVEAIDAFVKAQNAGSAVARKNAIIAQKALLNQSSGAGAVPGHDRTTRPAPDADAIYRQARDLHRTANSLADYAKVIELYRAAAMKSHRSAAQMLSLILSRPTPAGTIDPAWMKQTSLVRLDDGSAAVIGVAGEVYEREASPIIDLLPPAFSPAQ